MDKGLSDQIYAAWTALIEAADHAVKGQLDGLLVALRRGICQKIVSDAQRGSKLGDHDDLMYTHYLSLMQVYGETVAVCEQHAACFVTAPVKSIMEGINNVLATRLRQFSDALSDAMPFDGEGNPVTLEKKAILQKTSVFFDNRMANQIRIYKEKMVIDGVYLRIRFGIVRALADDTPTDVLQLTVLDLAWRAIAVFCGENLYNIYQDGVRTCSANVNDLSKRKVTQYLFDVLEIEHEVLVSIIRIQIAALEQALSQNAVESFEQLAVQRALSLIREGYQHFCRAMVDTRDILYGNESKTALSEETNEGFMSYLQNIYESQIDAVTQVGEDSVSLSFASMADRYRTFSNLLITEADALIDQFQKGFFQAAYRFERTISDESVLADGIVNAFIALRDQLSEIMASADSNDGPLEISSDPSLTAILNGIYETIGIKVESLKESIEEFNEKSRKLVAGFIAEKGEWGADERESARRQVQDGWIERLFLGDLETLVREDELPVFREWRQREERKQSEYDGKIGKCLLTFNKEVLLYELSTFEEILIYSVTRMRGDGQPHIQDAVTALDKTMSAIETLLKMNGVDFIRPAPHEPFNGREHEVLMAEKQDGFKKGEIIKPVTTGYRQKDSVILRASVIAAL